MYVPGHKDIPVNEIADKHAKEAAKIQGPYAKSDVSLMAARSAIKREVRDKPSTHRVISKSYANHDEKVDRARIKTRKAGALIAQLRSGHHKNLAYYQNFVDSTKSDKCQRCGDEKVDTVEHWLTECAQTLAARQRIFGHTDLSLRELGTSPDKVQRLAEETLL